MGALRGRASLALASAALVAAVVTGATPPAYAQARPAPATETDAQVKAQQHFARAKELYAAGSYREAIAELEAAHELDPAAKDLVFNLVLVNEKLGKIDEALRWMQTYTSMDLDAQERTRADAATRRLEGAKRELDAQHAASATPQPAPAPPPREQPAAPEHGRIDAFTIGAAVIAVGGFAVGGVFGVMALSEKPSSGFVTGRDGTYADLQDKADTSHAHAQIADIGLAVGVVATIATAVLYFARTKNAAPARATVGPSQVVLGGRF